MFRIVKFFFLLLISIRFFVNAQDNSFPKYEKYVDAIVKAFVIEMKQELNLDCEGDGGRMPGDVEEIYVKFSASRRATIEEARGLLVYTSEKFLRVINANEKIRPFLREFPFNSARVDISIGFDNECNNHFADGTISLASVLNGKIFYHISNPIEKYFNPIFVEPYEEAAKLASFSSLKPEDLKVHHGPAYEKCVDELLINFAKEAYKKWNLYCCTYGGKTTNGVEELAIKFVTDKRTPLEKARALYVAVTERFNQLINASSVLRSDLREYPFPIRRTKVYISFEERNGCYYEDGSIAYVNQENDIVYYYTEPPMVYGSNPLHPPLLHEERYEDAKKIVLKMPQKNGFRFFK